MFRDFSRKVSAEVRVPRPLAAGAAGVDDDDVAVTLDQGIRVRR
jgi:hypothetical protein